MAVSGSDRLVLNSCLFPQVIYRRRGINPATGKHFTAASADDLKKWTASAFEELPVRCGRCINCKKAKASSLIARCVAESRMHDDSAFVTLTVSDEKIHGVFPNGSLVHEPFQLWMKRLRKRLCFSGLKYMMCGEYGELSQRPHYHAIVFGVSPYEYVDSGVVDTRFNTPYRQRYDNPVFQDTWSFGQVYVGTVTPASVAYITGYTLKQDLLGRDSDWYKSRDLLPEYVKWSRRPGLGWSYFHKFGLDLLDVDRSEFGVSIDGKRLYAGRYFSDLLQLHYPEHYDKLLMSYGNDDSNYGDYERLRDALAARSRRLDCMVHNQNRSRRL